jgi:hypothetical protein
LDNVKFQLLEVNDDVQNEHLKYSYPWLPVKSLYLKKEEKFDLPHLIAPSSAEMAMTFVVWPENGIT